MYSCLFYSSIAYLLIEKAIQLEIAAMNRAPALKSSSFVGVSGPRRPCVSARVAARESLVPETLKELQEDVELQKLHEITAQPGGQEKLTAREKRLRQRSLDNLNLPSFGKFSTDKGVSPYTRKPTTIFQASVCGFY